MSLVLEALRRVEKADGKPGSVGVAVSSYRPRGPRRSSVAPLLLGLGTGGVFVYFFGPATGIPNGLNEPRVPEAVAAVEAAPRLPVSKPMPSPPVEGTRVERPGDVRRFNDSGLSDPAAKGERGLNRSSSGPAARPVATLLDARTPAPLILQAVSERDSRPIAVINDQLVKEGDLMGGVRIVRIGADSVEVLLENGTKSTVRFAPPPPAPSPSPSLELR